jgi:hypothetical protein
MQHLGYNLDLFPRLVPTPHARTSGGKGQEEGEGGHTHLLLALVDEMLVQALSEAVARRAQQEERNMPPEADNICYSFRETGICRRLQLGDTCGFSHDRPGGREHQRKVRPSLRNTTQLLGSIIAWVIPQVLRGVLTEEVAPLMGDALMLLTYIEVRAALHSSIV